MTSHGSRRHPSERPRSIFPLAFRLLLGTCLISIASCSGKSDVSGGMIILGMDGMDYRLVQTYLEEGRLPNIQRLMATGGLKPLQTTMPPQSPVAWSTFITGGNPGHHGVFDFIHRDPSTIGDPSRFVPFRSSSRAKEGRLQISIRSVVIPLTSGKVELLRRGKPFWEPLVEAGIPVTLVRMPANFPPQPSGATCLSGMDTPDLIGTSGTFSFYSTGIEEEESVDGGRLIPVVIEDGRVDGRLIGPPNPLRRTYRGKRRPKLEVGFTVWIDAESRAAKFRVQDSVFLLREGEWSEWIPVRFDVIPHLRSLGGICKLYLKEAGPGFQLYVSPINLDPADPALPISEPSGYAAELADAIGPFYTQEMAEDTKALANGVLSDAEYLRQAKMVLEEQIRIFDHVLDGYSGGLLFYYFSSIDQNSHVFWRAIDPKHPLYTPELAEAFGSVIPELYEAMDRVVGRAMAKIDPSTTLLVMSDHGFTSYRRSFNLNSWLLDEGYVKLRDPARRGERPLFLNVDWSRTRAYGLGLNGLYLNLRGREKVGIVGPGEEADHLLAEISRKLLEFRDPQAGGPVVRRVFPSAEIYSGEEMAPAPDLLIGYEKGYRASWKTILGNFPRGVLSDNEDKWSGDHCVDPALVPGVLISDRPIVVEDPRLSDLAPGILSYFGIAPPESMEGRPRLLGGP